MTDSPKQISSLTVRAALPTDVPFLKDMIWEALMASPTFVNRFGVDTLRQMEDGYWEKWLVSPEPAFVALDPLGNPLGAITVKPNDAEQPVRGWRIGIGVAPSARGQGVGQRLIECSLDFARQAGAEYVSLLVDPANTRAIALYRRVGFVDIGPRDGVLAMRFALTNL